MLAPAPAQRRQPQIGDLEVRAKLGLPEEVWGNLATMRQGYDQGMPADAVSKGVAKQLSSQPSAAQRQQRTQKNKLVQFTVFRCLSIAITEKIERINGRIISQDNSGTVGVGLIAVGDSVGSESTVTVTTCPLE